MDAEQIKELKGDVDVSDAVKKAREDFRYVLSQSNYITPNYLDYQSIEKNGVTHGYALVLPFNTDDKELFVPAGLVKKDDPKMFVAAVCYQGGKPVDLLMFNSVLFAKTKKPVKYDKKRGEYVVKIKDIKHDSMQVHALGHVIGNL